MPHTNCQYEHSSDRRRRALFPCDEETNDSDLGHISPLSYESNQDESHFNASIQDYELIGVIIDGEEILTEEEEEAETTTIENDTATPPRESPTKKHLTPNEHTNPAQLPKLIRKSQPDSIGRSTHSQNNLNTSCKVRTALFQDLMNISLPTRSFYSKTNAIKREMSEIPRRESNQLSTNKKRKQTYICGRKRNSRTSGQINAGVRHKIRKPKGKKLVDKELLLQAAINIIDNSPLNDYLAETAGKGLIKPPTMKEQENVEPIRKRPHSPEPNQNRKFFKSSRHNKGIVTVNNTIKLEYDNGRMSLIEKPTKYPKLVDKRINPKTNDLNTSVDLKDTREGPEVLLSPTSQMCDMTLGLKLNSPTKAMNLTPVLEAMPTSTQKKLYPIFYGGSNQGSTPKEMKRSMKTNVGKKMKPIAKDQLLLDAGQKRFGITHCPECDFVYHLGDPNDEILHLDHHAAGPVFRFKGWKNEKIVCEVSSDTRIIQILPNDSKIWWKKVKDVLSVVDRDLGFFDLKLIYDKCQIFLCIYRKMIVGVLVAEDKKIAHRLLTSQNDDIDLCSEESYPIKCGIARLWVHQNHRKAGIASALVNSLKKHYIFGHVLSNDEIALSTPTIAGKNFAERYFQTSNYLIYYK